MVRAPTQNQPPTHFFFAPRCCPWLIFVFTFAWRQRIGTDFMLCQRTLQMVSFSFFLLHLHTQSCDLTHQYLHGTTDLTHPTYPPTHRPTLLPTVKRKDVFSRHALQMAREVSCRPLIVDSSFLSFFVSARWPVPTTTHIAANSKSGSTPGAGRGCCSGCSSQEASSCAIFSARLLFFAVGDAAAEDEPSVRARY